MSSQNLGVSKKVPDRIYEYFKEEIKNGRFISGEKIPSEPDLVQQLNVSRNSLREAITRLEHEGYLVRKRGVGTFVMSTKIDKVNAAIDKLYSTSQLIASQGKIPGTQDLTTKNQTADEIVAEKLGIPLSSPVICVTRKRTADGAPFCWDESYFLPEKALEDQESMRASESLMSYVEKKLNIKIDHAIATLKPAICDPTISKKLDIAVGSLMYMVEQVHYLQNNKPIWFSRVWYPEEAINVKILVTW